MRWRFLLSPAFDGPHNMAVDHALMARARDTGESVVRIYAWSAPVLSLGRNQRARDVYDERELARRAITVVRRPTGGRALLHHREITYSVTAPVISGESLGAAYRRVNHLVLHALDSLGVAATLARPTTRSPSPSARPCFAEPASGEIVVDGRKLAGSAQWRDGGVLLQHGSLLVDDDQAMIPALMRVPANPSPPPATLREILGRAPTPRQVADALFAAVREFQDTGATALSSREIDALDPAAFARQYRDSEWTWRR